ncbi:MAG: IS1380 family transposase [Candidatus Acidiferrales bacterium]
MQGTSWAGGLELIGDDERLVAHTGMLPLRLLAQRLGLTCGLSAGMRRRGFDPVYDRGQVLVDLALMLIDGGEAISDFRALAHLAPVIGPVPSTPTVWRTLNETGDLQLARVNAAVVEFRRHWWGLLAARREGFPWLKVAGKELTGITVIDLDASIVLAGSDKENAKATYKGGTGFCPNLATCDNTGDMLAIDPRPGNSASNCAHDNIALLDLAVSRLPGPFRHNVLVRLDGAGFSHELLEHIAAGGGRRGRHWEFSVGWACTDAEMDAIARLPKRAWTAGIDQNGDVLDDTFVADLTGLLDLDAWTARISGLRILVREEPLHPRYRKRATEREKQLGKRYQLVATSTRAGQLAWLDARHRSHVHVENDVKQAKALGLNRWPSRHWTINVAWTQIVALAANLLACFRHLALPAGELREAAPKLLRFRLLHVPARLTRGQRKRWLHLRADWPWTSDLISAWRTVRALPPTP